MGMGEEAIVTLPCSPGEVRLATHVRGSVICSSQRSLRQRNLFDAYARHLDPGSRDALLAMLPSVWAPAQHAVAHYQACEALALREDVMESIGADSGAFLNASFVSVLVRFSREAGITPWSVLAQIERLRERLWQGSSMAVFKLGPKEARVEWHGQPCARFHYYRVAFGAFMGAVFRPFARALHIRRLPGYCTSTTIGYRVSWV